MSHRVLPDTVDRVPQHTPQDVNRRIRQDAIRSIERAVREGPDAIEERLRALDREWDIERTLETNAAIASLVGLGLGALVHRRFFVLPAVVASFLLQHALQGWCPPLALFRRLGVRTAREIDEERYALKALRGDFRPAGAHAGPAAPEQIAVALDAAAR
jgi:hypothetical protein